MVSPQQLIWLLKKGINSTGIKRITFHQLRHTFATLYMQNSGNLYDLQKILGHSSVNTTERYRHTDPEYLKSRCGITDYYGDSAQTPPEMEKRRLSVVR